MQTATNNKAVSKAATAIQFQNLPADNSTVIRRRRRIDEAGCDGVWYSIDKNTFKKPGQSAGFFYAWNSSEPAGKLQNVITDALT